MALEDELRGLRDFLNGEAELKGEHVQGWFGERRRAGGFLSAAFWWRPEMKRRLDRAIAALTERKAPVEVEGLVQELLTPDYWVCADGAGAEKMNCAPVEAALALQSQATELATLKQQLAELEAENFTLAAGACHVEGGLIGDEHGHFACTLKQQLAEREEALREIVEPLGNEPLLGDRGYSPGKQVEFWRKLAIGYRRIAAQALTRTDGGDQ
jgi:hypothetical protein